MDQGQNRASGEARRGQISAGRAGECFTFPFPPRECADRGAKWLLSDPAHLRHVLRVVALELSEGLDFERLEPVLTEEISQQLQQQVADRIFRVPYRDAGERASGAACLAAKDDGERAAGGGGWHRWAVVEVR